MFITPEVAVVHARQRSANADGQLAVVEKDPMESILQMTLT
ncbi:hypothetical protein [Actinomadura sp. KC345]|nr:hypothetical protein [Actinomadura sp. KC345]